MGYLLGRGCVFIGERDGADIKILEEFHTNSFEVAVENEYAEHFNSCGALKTRDLRIPVQSTGMAKIGLDTHSAKIVAKALAGEVVADAGTSFTDLPVPVTLVAGNIFAIPKGYVDLATLTVEDNTDSALSLGDDYTVNMAAGLVTIVDLTGFTQPLKVSGQTKAGSDISMMTETAIERFVRFNGINIADGNKPVIVDIFRGSFEPANLPVKLDGNDFATFEFEVPLLEDANSPLDGTLGKYGKYRLAA